MIPNIKYYKPSHFKGYELVNKEVYNKWGEDCIFLFDPKILYSIDNIREYFNKSVHINDWYWNGQFKDRGLRQDDSTTGVTYSQHKYGRAIDFVIDEINSDDIRKVIIDNKFDDRFSLITALETDIFWVHIDCRNVDTTNGLFLFKK
jgi:hypothetical protein